MSHPPVDPSVCGQGAGLALGPDGRCRCSWGADPPEYRAYHDEEWGFPVGDDRRLFEKLCLEGFQAGLSWLTILRKREAFRAAFAGFVPEVVAGYGPADVERLLGDPAIVRHRGKIEAVVHNAARFCELVDEAGSLAAYVWGFEPPPAARPERLTWGVLRTMSTTPEAVALSADLKRRGWRFVGPTTVYAFMQAMGLVNDHVEGCWVRPVVDEARRGFLPPGPR